MNQITLIGNVGAAPELKEFGEGGNQVAEFSLATNRKWTNKDGSKGEEATWFRCKVWGKRANPIMQYVSKGDKLALTGRVSIRQDNEGRYWTEVIVNDFEFLGSPRGAKPATAGVGADAPSPTADGQDDLPW